MVNAEPDVTPRDVPSKPSPLKRGRTQRRGASAPVIGEAAKKKEAAPEAPANEEKPKVLIHLPTKGNTWYAIVEAEKLVKTESTTSLVLTFFPTREAAEKASGKPARQIAFRSPA